MPLVLLICLEKLRNFVCTAVDRQLNQRFVHQSGIIGLKTSKGETVGKRILLWVDCEMTGLGAKDELIEIACVPTNMSLEPLDPEGGIDIVIKPSAQGFKLLEGNDFVYKMHQKSGLFKLLEQGVSVGAAQEQMLEYVKRFAPKEGSALLAGNSVHIDRGFLVRYMPELTQHLHYRIVDTSTIKELAGVWYPNEWKNAPAKKETHRALDDILESIEELKYYQKTVFK
jgi:oligoribonuclease